LLSAATDIGEQLAALAFVGDGEAHWTGLVPLADHGFQYRTIGTDLYEGTAGVAIFLAYLARATGRSDFADLARAAYAGAARRNRDSSVGAFTGAAGLLYTALHLAAVLDDPIADALDIIGSIAGDVRKDRVFDVLGGSAGCILVMLQVAARYPSTDALSVARACGRHLVRHAVEIDGGLGWPPGPEGGRPLLGLAHGAGGVAAALGQLAVVAPDPRFTRAARRALAYERAHFVPHAANWPDRRGDGGGASRPERFGWAWCHGAPGVGLARLMTPLPEAEADVGIAAASTDAHGFGGFHNLCHGDLGNAELLVLAGERRQARRRAHTVLDYRRRAGGWLCGTPDDIETPSLMTGIAGIGYQLLRLADPDAVPSVLTLAGPV
jgi:type 2 lantibiotic biosynthesis protein LanM